MSTENIMGNYGMRNNILLFAHSNINTKNDIVTIEV